MSNEILVHTSGTYFCWADSSQYNNYGSILNRTHEMRLKGLATVTARQGAKADLGIKRAGGYVVKAAVSFAVAPVAGAPVEFYWSSSSCVVAASGNDGGYYGTNLVPAVSGVDGPFTGPGSTETILDQTKELLNFIGVLPAANAYAAGDVQSKIINSYFTPPQQYGCPVVKNGTAQAFHAGGSGVYFAMIPVMDEVQ